VHHQKGELAHARDPLSGGEVDLAAVLLEALGVAFAVEVLEDIETEFSIPVGAVVAAILRTAVRIGYKLQVSVLVAGEVAEGDGDGSGAELHADVFDGEGRGGHAFVILGIGLGVDLALGSAGDEVDVNVTFPEKYQAADLAGKPALFKVKIHEVKAKELPELNDEFAQDVSEFNTLEEYKEDLKKHLEVQKEDEAKRTKEDEAIQKIIDKSTMEIPEAMIKTQCENMVNEFAQRLAQSGLSMEQYMQFSGLTLDKLEEQVRPEAETRIKSSLVLEQIAKDENIEVSEEEIDAEIEKMAKAYGMEADKLKEYMGDAEKESMKRDISVTKAVDLVMENVKERAKAKTKKEKEAEAEENAEENAEE